MLKSAAKTALPIAAGALGTAFGGPVGGMIGSQLGSAASNLFELELEGLSNEDKEFEVARAYVRFANNAIRNAARNPRRRYYPRQVARNAYLKAARRYAPGFLRRKLRVPYGYYNRPGAPRFYPPAYYGNGNGNFDQGQPMPARRQASGTWYRQGNRIIINL
jgi:hypothetical protein